MPEIAGAGFNYLELSLSEIAALNAGEFGELSEYLKYVNADTPVFSDMLPGKLRVTGPDVSAQAQHEYLKTAFERAKALGAELIVFDAAAARNVPSGYDFPLARRQLGNFMRILQGHAADAKLRVAVRNYRRAECNLINTVSEAALLPALLMLDRIGIAADTVQMALSSEPLDSIERAGMLMHVYVGNALTRRLPSAGDGEDYPRVIQILREQSYSGRVSCVCRDDFSLQEAAAALDCLRAMMPPEH